MRLNLILGTIFLAVGQLFAASSCFDVYNLSAMPRDSWFTKLEKTNPENKIEIQRINQQIRANSARIQSFLHSGALAHWSKPEAELFLNVARSFARFSTYTFHFGKRLKKENYPQEESLFFLFSFSELQNFFRALEKFANINETSKGSRVVELFRLKRQVPNLEQLVFSEEKVNGKTDPFKIYVGREKRFQMDKEKIIKDALLEHPDWSREDVEQMFEKYLYQNSEFIGNIPHKSEYVAKAVFASYIRNYSGSIPLADKNILGLMPEVKIKIVESHAGDFDLANQRHKNVSIVGYSIKGEISFDGIEKGSSADFTGHDILHQKAIQYADIQLFKELEVTNKAEVESLQKSADILLSARLEQIKSQLPERQQKVHRRSAPSGNR
jgi:hypothetical protein